MRRIDGWIDGLGAEGSRHLFWLSGLAGTGKSTIANTVAKTIARRDDHITLSYFFSRGEGDTQKAKHLVTTIAVQLAIQSATKLPKLRRLICDAVVKKADIADVELREQWECLILTPLTNLGRTLGGVSLVLVMDALDECENLDDVRTIIRLSSEVQRITTLRFCVFLTSRPEVPIQAEFRTIVGDTYQNLILHHVEPAIVDDDIRSFFNSEFEAIAMSRCLSKGWPGLELIIQLVERSGGLFIWASTACRFVGDSKSLVNKKLVMLLDASAQKPANKSPDQSKSPEQKLDEIYCMVLKNSVGSDYSDEDKIEFCTELREVLGAAVVLSSPLAIDSLGALLQKSPGDIKNTLLDLSSILDMPHNGPLRLHHPSFRDFLVSRERCEDELFWVEEKAAHRAMADHCVRLLSAGKPLKEDICGLGAPGTPRSDIDKQRVDSALPPEVQYACRYWVHHWVKSDRQLRDGGPVHSFLTDHLLYYLEALSLIGRIRDGIGMVHDLLDVLDPESSIALSALLHDLGRFLSKNCAVMDEFPLQLYCSSLLFAPGKSVTRTLWRPELLPCISLLSPADSDWTACFRTLEGRGGKAMSVAFSPDGRQLASASDDGTVNLWAVVRGERLVTVKAHSEPVFSVVFSPDGLHFASASEDGTIKIWLAATRAHVRTLRRHDSRIASVVYSPDGKQLASASWDKTVKTWDAATGVCIKTLKGHSDWVDSVTYSPNGKQLASASHDSTVKLWDAATGVHTRTFKGHHRWVNSVAFSPDGYRLASGSFDKTIKLWAALTSTCILTFRGHSDIISSVALSPSGRLLASASKDNTVRLWNAETGVCVANFQGHSGWVESVTFSPDGRQLASASDDTTVKIWDVETALETMAEPWDAQAAPCPGASVEHRGAVNSITFSADGRRLASASDDETVILWDAALGVYLSTFEGHQRPVTSVVFSPSGQQIASGSHDTTAKLWDVETGACIATFEGHKSWVNSVTFSPNGKQLTSGSQDFTARLWDTETRACLVTYKGHESAVDSVAISPDGLKLASASGDKSVKLWDAATGTCLLTLGHNNRVNSVVFSPDGGRLASASRDLTVKLWDPETGACIKTLEGFGGSSSGLWRLGAGSGDQIVTLWNSATGQSITTLEGYSGNVWFDATGLRLHTDFGTLALDGQPAARTAAHGRSVARTTIGIGIRSGGEWVTWNEQKVLWLPDEYRRSRYAIAGAAMALGCQSGRVLIFQARLGTQQ